MHAGNNCQWIRLHWTYRQQAPDQQGLTGALPDQEGKRHVCGDDCAENNRGSGDGNFVLARHFASRPPRFIIDPARRREIGRRIVGEFPGSAHDAASRGDRIVAGQYDLLGYRGLTFGVGEARIDWHLDPVHGRRAPRRFWADVPFLDPSCGDHKIIWELNRHQHWIALGRAWWLTNTAAYRDRFRTELASWIDANPPMTGINWASMLELALRSISWVWGLHFFVDPDAQDEVPWIVDLLMGVDSQLTQVERNLSYYFSPNTHLLGEALALYVGGRALPELAASRRREATGRRILTREIARQLAIDGGHCALDFYLMALIVARITCDPIADEFERAAARLAFAARLLADDRGRVPHIGDDDGGVLVPLAGRAPDDLRDSLATASALLRRADLRVGQAPEETVWLLCDRAVAPALDWSSAPPATDATVSAALPDTGYYISRSATGDHLVVDGGPHGYQNGGHAHADALSLTFTIRGLPLLIDPGTGCYTARPELRDRFRSTPLHNTLVLDGRSQSVPRGPFHWECTADAHPHRWRTNGGFDYFDGSHDGYRPAEHRRHVLVLHDELLVVADLVRAEGAHAAAVHWHFDPAWAVHTHGRFTTIDGPAERVDLVVPHGLVERFTGDSATGLGWYAPAYGRLEPTTTIRISHCGAAPFWIVSVFGLNSENSVVAVDTIPVWAEAGVLAHATAIRIERAESTDYLLIAEPSGEDAHATWRVFDFETDARMLFCRTAGDRQLTRVALVDGTCLRAAGMRGVQLALPRVAPDFHVDMSGLCAGQPRDPAAARIVGLQSGARLVISGCELAVALERRAVPRLRRAVRL